MTQETTMHTEPMNVDTKDLSCAEALELAIAETRLALCEFGDLADERLIVRDAWCEDAYQKVDAGLDRCKAAADGLAAYSRVLEMANNAAGERIRTQSERIRTQSAMVAECLIAELDRDDAPSKPQATVTIKDYSSPAAIRPTHTRWGRSYPTPQDRQAQHYDRRPSLKCAAWVIGLVLLGAAIEAANGLLGRLL